jgi:hypothetical protein
MRVAIGLLALSLLGADAPSPPGAPNITFDLRVLEMNGVDWRAAVYPQLQCVTRQGNATVWTAPAEVVKRLQEKAGRVVASPKLRAATGSPAHITDRTSRAFVSGYVRYADGPVNHASYVGYAPQVESTREGMAATVTGRKLDQGVLAQIVLEDSRVTAVHTVGLSEVQEPAKGTSDGKRWEKMGVKIQVPEVVKGEVAGEWLIPNDGVLVVSLGVQTVADKEGRAVVRERLALIEARSVDLNATMPTALIPGMSPRPMAVAFTATAPTMPLTPTMPAPPATAVPMPAPALPSRSLPQPRNAWGMPIALPPLPDDHAPPTSLPGSSEPCATPQLRKPKATEPLPEGRSNVPAADPESTRAGYVEEPCCDEAECGSCCAAAGKAVAEGASSRMGKPFECPLGNPIGRATTADAPPPPPIVTPAKTFVFRVPWSGSVTLEIRAVAQADAMPFDHRGEPDD